MEHRFTSRLWRVRYGAILLAASCCLRCAFGQTAEAGNGESILQKRYEAAQRFQAGGELDKAAQQYRIFVADALGEIAIGSAQAGRYDKAQDDFDEALRLVPDFPMLQLESARAALQASRLERASVLATALLKDYPQNKKIQTDAHALLGRILMKMDKNAEAKLQFEAAIYLDPTFENGYELGVVDLNLGDAAGARTVFAEMLSSFGDTAALHLSFGQAYGNSDFQSDAVAELLKAIAKDPRLPGVHYSLAVAYLASSGDSKLTEAETELRKEISISPQDGAAYAALGHLIATHGQGAKDQTEAEADLKRATELDPTNADAFLFLGQFEADEKRTAEAETALRQSIALTRDASRNAFQVQKAHYLLARLLMQSGDKAEADKELATSQTLMRQKLERDQGRLSQYLGEERKGGVGAELSQPVRRVQEGKVDQTSSPTAVDAFEKRMTPAIADSYNNLGAIAGSEGNYSAALVAFQRAAEWLPSLPGLDFNWGRAAFEAGDYALAIEPLTRYLAKNPKEDGARRTLGLSQFMAKDYAAAQHTLETLISDPAEPPTVQFAYADSMLKTGDAKGAISRLEGLESASTVLAQVRPALREAYAKLGRDQLAQGNAKDAVLNLQHAIQLDPDNAGLRQSLQEASSKSSRN